MVRRRRMGHRGLAAFHERHAGPVSPDDVLVHPRRRHQRLDHGNPADTASFTQNFVYNGDQIQFTSGWGPAGHTVGTIEEYGTYSINLVLRDPTFAAIDALTPAPATLDRSDWSSNGSETYMKFYLNNDANRYILGNIQSISVTGSAIPEPSTYAALAGAATLALALYRRRRRKAA